MAKISLSGSDILAMPPQTPKNRFEQLTFSKRFEHNATWNSIEQYTPSCLNTAMKVVSFLPRVLIEAVAKIVQAIGNCVVSVLNSSFGARTVEPVKTSEIEEPSFDLEYTKSEIEETPEDTAVSSLATAEETPPVEASVETADETPPPVDTSLATVDEKEAAPEEETETASVDDVVETETPTVTEEPAPTVTTLIEKKADGWQLGDATKNHGELKVEYPAPQNNSSYAKHFVAAVGLVLAAVGAYFGGSKAYEWYNDSGNNPSPTPPPENEDTVGL